MGFHDRPAYRQAHMLSEKHLEDSICQLITSTLRTCGSLLRVVPTAQKNVVVVETNLNLDAQHPDYDDQAMTSLLEAVQRFLAQNKGRVDEMRIVPVRDWVGNALRPLRQETTR